MNTTMLKRARKHFCSPDISPAANRAHIRKWVRSLRFLGDKWLLAPRSAA